MALDLEPLGTSRRADEVFDRLRSRIFSGAFEPGEQLPGERVRGAADDIGHPGDLPDRRHGLLAELEEEGAASRVVDRLLRAVRLAWLDLGGSGGLLRLLRVSTR